MYPHMTGLCYVFCNIARFPQDKIEPKHKTVWSVQFFLRADPESGPRFVYIKKEYRKIWEGCLIEQYEKTKNTPGKNWISAKQLYDAFTGIKKVCDAYDTSWRRIWNPDRHVVNIGDFLWKMCQCFGKISGFLQFTDNIGWFWGQ